jgi:MtN3 and saliva related transmembrane protein
MFFIINMQSIYLVAGFLGTFIISVVLVPQIYRTFKTRDVEGISFTWLVMHTLGCSLWILYGIGITLNEGFLDAAPILFTNGLLILSTFALLYGKFKFGKPHKKQIRRIAS